MSRGLDRTLTVAGAALLLAAAGMFAWQQVRDASAVHVAGRVVALDCAGGATSCVPVIEFTARDGQSYRVRGRLGGSATTYEVDGEWLPILHHPDTGVASVRGETPELAIFAVLGALVGSVLLGLGWIALIDLPLAGDGLAWPRGVAAGVGVTGCVTAYGVVGWRYAGGSAAVAMAFFAAAFVVPALIRLGRRSHHRKRHWRALPFYGLAVVAVVVLPGLVVLPEGLRQGLLACAPFAMALTLPLQVRVWPAMEQWLAGRRERTERRARLLRALESADQASEIVVRVDSVDEDARTAQIVRRAASGDSPPLRASLNAFVGVLIGDGPWFLLEGPRLEQRPAPGGSGYREVVHEDWLVSAERAEALGDDLELALRSAPEVGTPAWAFPAPLLVCAAGSVLGSFLVADYAPPLSGEPIPATGLVERLDAPLSRSGSVAEVREWPGLAVGDPCKVRVEPTHRSEQTCQLEVTCAGTELYPGGGGGYTRCVSSRAGAVVGEDTSMDDGDPAIRIDTRSGLVVVRARAGVRDRSVTVALSPP